MPFHPPWVSGGTWRNENMEPFLGSHEKSDKAEVMEASAPLATLQRPPKNSVSKIKNLLMQLKKKSGLFLKIGLP